MPICISRKVFTNQSPSHHRVRIKKLVDVAHSEIQLAQIKEDIKQQERINSLLNIDILPFIDLNAVKKLLKM